MAGITSAAVGRSKQKPFGEKLEGFLKECPYECDVTFIVGPQKMEIKCWRVALKASSPAIHTMFKDTWDTAVTNQGEGIPLPDFEPNAFEAFLKILMSDDWSPTGIKEMNLSTDTIFKLIEISIKLKVLDLQESLQESTLEFFENFECFVKSEEFLNLPRKTLEVILSSNFIALDEVFVFEAALKWAKQQCCKRGVTPNGENSRHALGPALFQIRFPLMTLTNVSSVFGITGILSEMEKIELSKFISLSEQSRTTFDASNFPFKTEVRQKPLVSSAVIETLKIFEDSHVAVSPNFICDGTFHQTWLQVNHKIAVHSVEFLGPADYDSIYEAYVEIKKINSVGNSISVEKVNKTLKVKCRETFEIAFDPPVLLQATYIKDIFKWKNSPFYSIHYSLKLRKFAFTLKGDAIRSLCQYLLHVFGKTLVILDSTAVKLTIRLLFTLQPNAN